MNIVQILKDQNNSTYPLENYPISDLSTGWFISSLLKDKDIILQYYRDKSFNRLDNIDEYIDYIFVCYIVIFEECINYVVPPHKDSFEELINKMKIVMKKYKMSSVVEFLATSYAQVFSYESKYLFVDGMRKFTIDQTIKLNTGLKKSGIFEYLINNEPLVLFDRYDDFIGILKKIDSRYLVKFFSLTNTKDILLTYRFEELLGFIVQYSKANIELTEYLVQVVYEHIMDRFNNRSNEEIYGLEMKLKNAVDAFHEIQSKKANELEPIYEIVKKESEEYLKAHGQTQEYELSNKSYIEIVKKLEEKENPEDNEINKYLLITQTLNTTTKQWEPYIEKYNREYKSTFADMVSSTKRTNDYFTPAKLSIVTLLIENYSTYILFWVHEQKRIDLVFSYILNALENIYRFYKVEYDQDEIKTEIKTYAKYLLPIFNNKDTSPDQYFIAMLLSCIMSERVLRNVYIAKNTSNYIDKTVITMRTILGRKDCENPITLKLLGTHQLRWIRYFLLHDGDKVGLEYRNRLMHFRDIEINETNNFDVLKLLFIFMSIINTLLINSTKNDE
jgi:hypothetical protein